MDMGKWLVVRTQPRRERIAAVHLLRQGYEHFLPKEKLVLVSRGKKVTKTKVLFPSYIFVRVMPTQSWFPIRSTIGISHIVQFGRTPSIVPHAFINAFRAQMDKNGAIQLINKPTFRNGQELKIKRGPFKGFVGLYAGQTADERAQILLSILGQKDLVLRFEFCDLEAA